jgi:hypothetical protein
MIHREALLFFCTAIFVCLKICSFFSLYFDSDIYVMRVQTYTVCCTFLHWQVRGMETNTECYPTSQNITFLRKEYTTEKCNIRYIENSIFFMVWQIFCNSLGVTFVQKNAVFGFFGFYSCR